MREACCGIGAAPLLANYLIAHCKFLPSRFCVAQHFESRRVKTPNPLEALWRGDFAGRRELDLSNNGLTELPSEVFGLADTLEVLDLSGNALTTLPKDFNRLKKLKVLFCSDNAFQRLPPVLGDCQALSQIGFRRTGMRELPAESLPPHLRWLTLTDNRLARLPDALGERPALQKLMLAGNQLQALPRALANAENLELLRLSANHLQSLPAWLSHLPRLAWLAWAGNPFDSGVGPSTPAVDWTNLKLGKRLGQGASGEIYNALWRGPDTGTRAVAVKLFKGEITSDGLPEREMTACLAAGDHPRLTGVIGALQGHPKQKPGLVMPLLPSHWRPLARPPSPESCSRDVYAANLRLDLTVAISIAVAVGEALAHLHASNILHGDAYAHNVLWDGRAGDAVLSDFGAASFLPPGERGAYSPLEVLAWGRLLGELLDRSELGSRAPGLRALHQACVTPNVSARPSLQMALADLADRP